MATQDKAKKFELKAILEKHDASAFKKFCLENDLNFVSDFTEEKLSRLMHALKARQMYHGELFQMSRNHFRLERLETSQKEWSDDLKKYVEAQNHYPICLRCEYFRKAPVGEKYACMHIGATPEDLACKAFKNTYPV